ncbi:hypothetical protein B0F90DRAFT_1721901 [Multifurca ochricompacta]|uniref:Secreted protein n=1 Tax=Multifurca ochricompacta TaxID=376703 RepID=A0AAD4QNC9_9AGAM|nr:hypothetical protein B0F90DRAFT_1721901 [Multifurca ochricompacta]
MYINRVLIFFILSEMTFSVMIRLQIYHSECSVRRGMWLAVNIHSTNGSNFQASTFEWLILDESALFFEALRFMKSKGGTSGPSGSYFAQS